MNFKTNKLILFCNRRITPQIAKNWNNSEYLKSILNVVVVQGENPELKDFDFLNLINYIIYSLGNYYRGNTIFVFQLLVAFLYLITPVDLVSDFLPGIGYLDDLMLLKMILDTYSNELANFNRVSRDMLDIKYMRVDPKVLNDFTMNPTEAIELIIKERKLEVINGEEIINRLIEDKSQSMISEYIDFDIIQIIKYELLNYLAKSKLDEVYIDEDLILSLIQIPDLVTKKDASYFLKNIEELLSEQNIEYKKEKRTLFNSHGLIFMFRPEDLILTNPINFVQVRSDYTHDRKQCLLYVSCPIEKLNYEHIVEIIDLSTQKHLFVETIINFEIILKGETLGIKVDCGQKQVMSYGDGQIGIILNTEVNQLLKIIKERVM